MSSPIRATFLVAALAACSWAVDEGEGARRTDLRLTIEALPTYEVSENGLHWMGLPNQVWQIGLEKMWLGERQDWGGPIYGLRCNGSTQLVHPSGYSDDNGHYANNSKEELQWYRLGVGLVGGWQTGPVVIDGLRLFGELTAFAEANAVYATLSNTTDGDSSPGYGGEAGVRVALLMAESDWYGGISVTALAGLTQVKFSVQPGGVPTTTSMDLGRSGVGLGVLIGRRF